MIGSATPQAAQLAVEELSVHFEGLAALAEVILAVNRHEVFGLIGPNGAGQDHIGQLPHRLSAADARVASCSMAKTPPAGSPTISGVRVWRGRFRPAACSRT